MVYKGIRADVVEFTQIGHAQGFPFDFEPRRSPRGAPRILSCLLHIYTATMD